MAAMLGFARRTRRDITYEYTLIPVERLHADAICQYRTASERATRIDSDDAH